MEEEVQSPNGFLLRDKTPPPAGTQVHKVYQVSVRGG